MKFLTTISLLTLLSISVFSQSPKPRPNVTKPKPSTTPAKKPDEKTEWNKVSAIENKADRVAALRKFIEAFPASEKKTEAAVMIVTAEAEDGFARLKDDPADAADMLKMAARDAPKPMPDKLFNETLAKFAANLYFRGRQAEALEIEKTLEEKADATAYQLLEIAMFYITIENGSEAKRVANAAIALQPSSGNAYQMLGLANRVDFQLEESAAAYARSLELEPDSLSARRGLAEMKRALGKADDAAALYREILAKDEKNLPARTGLILALFDAGKRSEAEAEMAKALEVTPNNVILLGSAAYWYAAHREGDKAVEYGAKAIEIEPRFIWSHIAKARGLMLKNDPTEAERTLLAARRYGNFPSLDYEVASAEVSAGFFREAAELLSKTFTIKDGVVRTDLGRRIERGSPNIADLMAYERQASIFAPVAADDAETAARLRSLLELTQQTSSATPDPDAVAAAADAFVKGDDKLKVHRQLFAAGLLLDKKIALTKVQELAKDAASNSDAGLDPPFAAVAVMASELYNSRALAISRGEYIRVPEVPRSTLSAILRGRIEEITGWALYEMNSADGSVLHLRRAVSVMPADSVYWRSSMWRLGSALVLAGKEAEGLDCYLKAYRPGDQEAAKYATITALYKRVKGTTDGLEEKIGPDPTMQETVAKKLEPTPTPEVKPEPTPGNKPEPTPLPTVPPIVPIRKEPTPTPEPTPELKAEAAPTPTPEAKAEVMPTPAPTPDTTVKAEQSLTPTPTPEAKVDPTPVPTTTPETKPAASPEATPMSSPTPEAQKQSDDKPKDSVTDTKPTPTPKDLFPPVVIEVPRTDTTNQAKTDTGTKADPVASPTPGSDKPVEEPKPTPPPEPEKKPDEKTATDTARPRVVETRPDDIKPCTITTSEESLTLQNAGGNLVILVGVDGDADLKDLSALSSSPPDIAIRPELDIAVKKRAIFLIRSVSRRIGVYQVTFSLPCGKKDVPVNVR